MGSVSEASWLRDQHDCQTLQATSARTICERVMSSRQILAPLRPRLIPDRAGRVTHREIILVAWDEKANTPHTIKLTTQFRLKKDERPIITPQTPGYRVERVRGTALYKIQFRIAKDGVELPVYGGKHLWVPAQLKNEWDFKKLASGAEQRQYLPFQDHLFHKELVERGRKYLERRINDAREELRTVPSRAFLGKTLWEMYPAELVLNVIVTEHTDPYLVFRDRKESILPSSSYFLGTLVEFAFHGPDTVADLCSSAPACGWTQFTNKPKRLKDGTVWPGTYNYTYKECRHVDGGAVIVKDFTIGTRDTHNAIKAAICYLDLEKMALPQAARNEFIVDPKRGGVYALAAYNGGKFWSTRLYARMRERGAKFVSGSMPFTHETIPRYLFENGTHYNEETHQYIRKYLWLWELLYHDVNIVVPIAPER